MRLRNNPQALDYLEQNQDIVIPFTEGLNYNWSAIFGNDNPLCLEIGIGKGDFILGLGKKNPNINYLGLEKFSTVIAISASKARELNLANVRLMNLDAAQLGKVLPPNSLTNIYLNFSDPWPKKRHHKRRLTAISFLKIYQELLVDGGQIIVKTDSDILYEDSLITFLETNYQIIEKNEDYQFEDSDAMSEYEQKFRQKGNKIHRIIVRKGG